MYTDLNWGKLEFVLDGRPYLSNEGGQIYFVYSTKNCLKSKKYLKIYE